MLRSDWRIQDLVYVSVNLVFGSIFKARLLSVSQIFEDDCVATKEREGKYLHEQKERHSEMWE